MFFCRSLCLFKVSLELSLIVMSDKHHHREMKKTLMHLIFFRFLFSINVCNQSMLSMPLTVLNINVVNILHLVLFWFTIVLITFSIILSFSLLHSHKRLTCSVYFALINIDMMCISMSSTSRKMFLKASHIILSACSWTD